MVYWIVGILDSWYFGLLVYWVIGILGCWYFGFYVMLNDSEASHANTRRRDAEIRYRYFQNDKQNVMLHVVTERSRSASYGNTRRRDAEIRCATFRMTNELSC